MLTCAAIIGCRALLWKNENLFKFLNFWFLICAKPECIEEFFANLLYCVIWSHPIFSFLRDQLLSLFRFKRYCMRLWSTLWLNMHDDIHSLPADPLGAFTKAVDCVESSRSLAKWQVQDTVLKVPIKWQVVFMWWFGRRSSLHPMEAMENFWSLM